MARNRRKAEGELTWRVVLRRLTILILVVGLLLGLIAIQRRNVALGETQGRLEEEIKKEKQAVAELGASFNRAATLDELKQKMAALGMAMAPPTEAQIRRMRDPAANEAPAHPRILAQTESPRRDARGP